MSEPKISDVDLEELREFAHCHSGEYPMTGRRIVDALYEIRRLRVYLMSAESMQRHQLEHLGLHEEFGPWTGCDLVDHLGEKLLEARAEAARVKAAVQHHHDQKGDNRCILDDNKLYHDVLGIEPDPFDSALPPEAEMLESCLRYIRQRQDPSVAGQLKGMTIAQLEAEVEKLRKALAGQPDPILAGSLREQIRAEMIETMGRAIDRLETERDAVIRLCYHPHEDDKGNWYYRIDIDPADGFSWEDLGFDDIDFDTEAEAHAAILKAAGLPSAE